MAQLWGPSQTWSWVLSQTAYFQWFWAPDCGNHDDCPLSVIWEIRWECLFMDKSKQVSRSYRELIQCSDSCGNVSGSRTNYSAWQAAHSKNRSKHNWVWHFCTCALIHNQQMFKGKETWNNVNKFLASIYRKQKWHAAISQNSGRVLQKEALSEHMLISPRLGTC